MDMTPLPSSLFHYDDVIMGSITSQITSLTIVYSSVYSGADQRKHQSYASLAFVWGIHRRPVNSPHKGPVTRKMFDFDDVIMMRYVSTTDSKWYSFNYCLYTMEHLAIWAWMPCPCGHMHDAYTRSIAPLPLFMHHWSGGLTRSDPRWVVRPVEGPNSFHWKNVKLEVFFRLHKISRTACCFGIRIFLKQYNWCESATFWYTDHQYLEQYSEIINNMQELPLIFCNYVVRSCGTWRKAPGQSPCHVDFRFRAIRNWNGHECLWPRRRLKRGTHA